MTSLTVFSVAEFARFWGIPLKYCTHTHSKKFTLVIISMVTDSTHHEGRVRSPDCRNGVLRLRPTPFDDLELRSLDHLTVM